jgi:hypothetical protein
MPSTRGRRDPRASAPSTLPVARPAAAAPPATSGVLAFFADEAIVFVALAMRPFDPLCDLRPLDPLDDPPPLDPLGDVRPLDPLGDLRPLEPLGDVRPLDPLGDLRAAGRLAAAERLVPAGPRFVACFERPFGERVVVAIASLLRSPEGVVPGHVEPITG